MNLTNQFNFLTYPGQGVTVREYNGNSVPDDVNVKNFFKLVSTGYEVKEFCGYPTIV